MPEKKTIERARRDKREGKAPSTQAGEFVREEIEHIREGQHGARSASQAIAIGLSKARRAGVDLPPPEKGEASEETRENAKRALEAGKSPHPPSRKRSRAVRGAAARKRGGGVEDGALPTRNRRGQGAQRRGALAGGAQGGSHQGPGGTLGGGREGGPHASQAQGRTRLIAR